MCIELISNRGETVVVGGMEHCLDQCNKESIKIIDYTSNVAGIECPTRPEARKGPTALIADCCHNRRVFKARELEQR